MDSNNNRFNNASDKLPKNLTKYNMEPNLKTQSPTAPPFISDKLEQNNKPERNNDGEDN